eukprot:CAMPEP_0173400770 /NCGR_PEP_ID=MMETSP1356-20130122/48922_1 /TAXON_ID=77927 ORGANISM="Hemiselmis virescens, Strain PCC157" /NCGR_SAMPLE_ID=MMETSP1356 /ASSEMBLY_ACC=CAM_ASM_000847 /LENGTH=55 /DNA_ID=CAMNT_0014360763 /DNA_START=60 /DNA_END=224 /DNA_ORIENTATION=-
MARLSPLFPPSEPPQALKKRVCLAGDRRPERAGSVTAGGAKEVMGAPQKGFTHAP